MGLAELSGQCCPALVERNPFGLMSLVHIDLRNIQLSLYLSGLVSDRLDLIRCHLPPRSKSVVRDTCSFVCRSTSRSSARSAPAISLWTLEILPLICLAPDTAFLRARASSVYPFVRGSRR